MRRPRFLRRIMPKGGHDESGFTLAELLVALSIETVIFGALAASFVVVLNSGSTVNENLKRSSDARLAAAYIVSDARNSSGPETSLTDTTSCPDSSPPVTGTPTAVARFTWDSPSRTAVNTSTANISNFVLVSGNLLRRHCEAGSLVNDQVLAGNVDSVTVACSANADCSGAPTSITVTITETLDTAKTAAPFVYSLTSAFRQVNGGGAPLPSATPHPLILLGGPCGGATGISIVGSSTMKVYGDAYINTTDGSGCQAMKLDGGGSTFQAGSTNFLAGGTCSAPAYLTCPTSTTYASPIGDPYANVAPPSTTGLTAQTNSCSSYGAQTAQPGVYANAFSPGGGATCTLATGVYYLKAGLNTNSGGVTIKSAPGGVLIYVLGGSISIAGGSTFNVSALSAPPTYSGIALWQAAADTSAITFSGDATIVIDGALYGPKAQLVIAGGSHAPIVRVLVVRSIDLNNSGHLVVGAASATPLSIGASGFPPTTWTVNRPYPTITLIGMGGDGNYMWSVAGMPAGMTLDPATGVVSGTPTVVANGTATVTLRDATADDPSVQSFTLNIVAGPTGTTSLTDWTVNKAYLDQLTATGGTTPYTWAVTNLPTGLTFNASSGAVTGTPTVVGAKSITVTATDAAGATDLDVYTVTINAVPTITTLSLPSGEKTAPYLATLAGATGTAPYAFTAPTLPAGLTLSTAGVISGTVSSTAVTTTVAITLTDAAGATVSKSLSLAVTAAPTISSVTLTNVATGGTAGRIQAGDSIKIVFSAQMNVSSLCSTWATDTANQSLTADNDVGVTVRDGTGSTNDTITVDSSSCTFNFGSLNLGVKTYVTGGDAVFGGIGTNKSTITWTVSTKTLLITLGAKGSGGTVATISTSTATYTASTSVRDSVGGSLSNSPLAIAAGRKF